MDHNNKMNNYILYLGLLLLCVVSIDGSIRSLEDEAREKMLKNYDRSALPSNQTKVIVGFEVRHFTMNKKLQSLDLDLWNIIEWHEPRLTYSEKEYQDLYLAFSKNQIWVPDLVISNSVSNDLDSFMRLTKVIIDKVGRALWIPPSHVKARCIMDMTYWPYDVHNCSVNLRSWTYSSKHIKLIAMTNTVEFDLPKSAANKTRSDWEVIGNSQMSSVKLLPCCDEEHVEIVANIILKRIGKAYWWSKQMPVIVLGLFNIALFLLSPSDGNRVVFGIIIFFVNLYFMENLTQAIGHSSTYTPRMVRLTSLQTLYNGIAIIATGIIFRLVKDPYCISLSPRMEKALNTLAKRLWLENIKKMDEQSSFRKAIIKEDMEIHAGNEQDTQSETNASTAKGPKGNYVVAVVLDRICIIVFTFMFLINMIAFSQVL